MDGTADATAAALGAWVSIREFFTPAMLFLVVNLVIGTIALTSRSHQRLRCGGYSSHDDVDAHHHQEPIHQDQYYQQQHEQQQYVPPPPAPLARTSSVLDRLRSIGLYRFRSGDFPPEYVAEGAAVTDPQDVIAPAPGDAHYARSRSEPAPVREKKRAAPSTMKKSSSEVRKAEVAWAPARMVQAAVLPEEEDVIDARADKFTDSFAQPPPAQQEQEEVYYPEEYVPPLRPATLARTSSVLDRLRSFSLYRFRSGDLAPDHAADPTHEQAAAAEEKMQAQVSHYSRSRSETARDQQNKKEKKQQQQAADARMNKSSSEARKPAADAAPGAAPEEAESVDARADNFINSFRQQLQLQRLNSLLNYKEMLNRGA